MFRQSISWVAALLILMLLLLLLFGPATGVFTLWPSGFLYSLGLPLAAVSAVVWLATHVRRR